MRYLSGEVAKGVKVPFHHYVEPQVGRGGGLERSNYHFGGRLARGQHHANLARTGREDEEVMEMVVCTRG